MKKNWLVALAFVLPIVLIAGLAISVYWPAAALAEHDFVYATCSFNDYNSYYPYNCAGYLERFYQVQNGELTTEEVPFPPSTVLTDPKRSAVPPTTRLFLHNVKTNESREINLAEVSTFGKLSGLLTSPDGVAVQRKTDRGVEFFPLFSGPNDDGYYLVKGKKKQKLNLIDTDVNMSYRDDMKFIGWVLD